MEETKNMQLTLVQPDGGYKDEDEIDLLAIFKWMKKLFLLWLVLAVGAGAIALAIGILTEKTIYIGDAQTLVGYSDGVPVGQVTSAQVIADAMDVLGIEADRMDDIRMNISISSVMSDKTNDLKTLYSSLITKSSEIDEDAINTLLSTGGETTAYIISFDYHTAGFTREEGIDILNAVVDSYRNYVEVNYNFNDILGSSVTVLDYQEYDYSEAVSIFSDTLDGISSYLSRINSTDNIDFRSQKTGYSFSDLQQITATLQDVELDQANAYIVLNGLTKNGADREITYYEWLIEETERSKAVEETRMAALNASIEAYEKDPVVYAHEDTVLNSNDDYYDSLLQQKQDVQATISGYDRKIGYYEMLIENFKKGASLSDAKKEQAEKYLATLNEKLNKLIEDIKVTADEYYEKAAFYKTVRVKIPAVAEAPTITHKSVIMVFGITEALLLVIYLGIAMVNGIKESLAKGEDKDAGKKAESK